MFGFGPPARHSARRYRLGASWRAPNGNNADNPTPALKRALFRKVGIDVPQRSPQNTVDIYSSSEWPSSQCRTTTVTPRARETSSPEHKQAAASAGPTAPLPAGPPSAPAAADQHRVQADRPRRRTARCWSRCACSTTCRRSAGRASCAPSGRHCANGARRPGFGVVHYSIQDDHARSQLADACGPPRSGCAPLVCVTAV